VSLRLREVERLSCVPHFEQGSPTLEHRMTLRLGDIYERKYGYARPSELIHFKVPKKVLSQLDPALTNLNLHCEEH